MKPYSQVILILLAVQIVVTGYLISISLLGSLNEQKFALLLVSELVLFAMMTYMYRTEKLLALPNPAWIAVGMTIVLGFFVSSVIFTF